MQTVQKVMLALVGAAMFYTAVAPESQTARVFGAAGDVWNTSLKTVTGQV